ncbi:CHAT domain-containing protein [candidate division KSB1 bacterium]|nr:CHAT domain-containing protein [candidate division KSB1 bacterium]
MAQQTQARSRKYGNPRRFECLHLALLLAGALFFPYLTVIAQERADSSQMRQDIRALELGKPIERDLKGGEVHTYQINLTAGQYLHVVADQRGIDVVATLLGPDGKQIIEVDSPSGKNGREPIMLVTDVSGNYRLEVSSSEKESAPGRYEAKIEELRRATPEDKRRVANRRSAERLYAEAEKLREQGAADSLRKAIAKYEEALMLWRDLDNRPWEAETLNIIGVVCVSLSDHQKALVHFQQAVPIWQALGNLKSKAVTLNNIAFIYNRLSENQKALESYGESLNLRRAVGDTSGEAVTLNNLGMVYENLNENRKALDHYFQALPLRRVVKDRRGEANTLNNIGGIYTSWGEYQTALNYHGQALAIRRDLNDRWGVANSLNNIGAICKYMGKIQKALDCYAQALALFQILGDRRHQADVLNNIGHIYVTLSEEQIAFSYFDRALTLRRDVNDRTGEVITLTNIGSVYERLGQSEKALEYYGKAFAISRALNDHLKEARVLNNMGSVYLDLLGDYTKALDHFLQALPIFQAAKDRHSEAKTCNNLGRVYTKLGEQQKALEYYNQSLRLSQAVNDRGVEAASLIGIARIGRNQGNLMEACRHAETALTLFESLRAEVVSPELRSSYFASVQKYYEFYIELLMQQHQQQPNAGYAAAASHASERARARSLLETLTEAHIDIRQGVDSTLVMRERLLQQQLNAKEQYRIKLLNGKHTPEQVAAAEKEIASLLTQYQEVQAQIRATSPSYAALTQPQPLNLSEIQQQVLDDNTILLEYVLGDERSFFWAVTTDTIHAFILPKRAEIDSVAKRVYNIITERSKIIPGETWKQGQIRFKKADAEYEKTANQLSQMILGPAAGLMGDKRLLIVANGALQYVPFAVLPDPKSASNTETDQRQPLIVKHEIVSLPSASVLAALRKEFRHRKPAPKLVAVLADPVFSEDDPRFAQAMTQAKKTTPDTTLVAFNVRDLQFRQAVWEVRGGLGEDTTKSFERLIFSGREAEAILAATGSVDNLIALGFDASHAAATSPELGRYRIIHFATHGLLNSEHPELSGLVLSLLDRHGNPQNGFLRLNEIYNLELNADLVVLSACQTALGKEISGEGLISLVRGFMYAGTPRVVSSLWSVQDEATAELMKRFYKKMLGKEKLRPIAALRAAQIEMWQKQPWQSPYFWAAFVLQGEWR